MSCWTGYAAGSREGDPAHGPRADGTPTDRIGSGGRGGARRAPLASLSGGAAAGGGASAGGGGARAAVQPGQCLRLGSTLAGGGGDRAARREPRWGPGQAGAGRRGGAGGVAGQRSAGARAPGDGG